MKTKWTLEWNSAQHVERTAFILVAVASFLNVLLGLLNYPIIGHDAYVHLNWLDHFTRLESQSVCYPRWLPDSFGGFGAPTFYFYPPLVYWIASLIHALEITSPALVFQIIQLSFSLLSVFTAFYLSKQIGGKRLIALTGALLYSFLTYRFCDVYVRNALTEHAALAFLPLVFLRFPNKLHCVVILSVGWVGLLLTNLPITYLTIISIGTNLIARRSFKEIPIHTLAFVLAVAISASYLFPAFGLRGLIHQRHLFDLPMHTNLFGFALLDLFQAQFDWLRILSISTILAGLFCFIAIFKNSDPEMRSWKWLIALAVFFQIPYLSSPLWHIVPGMPFVQFSWRWNGILLLAIAALYVKENTKIVHCVIIGLALITVLSELTLSRNIFVRPPLPISSFRMDAPEYAPKWTSNDPYEVIGITKRRMSDPPVVLLGLTMPTDSITQVSKSQTAWNFSVSLNEAASIRFHQFYWPYWKLYRGSVEIPVTPDPNGFATAEIPAGEYSISLKLVRSTLESTGTTVSLFGISLLAILLAFISYRSITKRRDTTSPPASTRKT